MNISSFTRCSKAQAELYQQFVFYKLKKSAFKFAYGFFRPADLRTEYLIDGLSPKVEAWWAKDTFTFNPTHASMRPYFPEVPTSIFFFSPVQILPCHDSSILL